MNFYDEKGRLLARVTLEREADAALEAVNRELNALWREAVDRRAV